MAATKPSQWVWEVTDPRRSGGAGDLAKLFKNEGIAAPGVLATDAPPDTASLLAREVIQNSGDAARELRDDRERQGSECPSFSIQFDFNDLVGEELSSVVSALDLAGLQEQYARAAAVDAIGTLGLARTSFLHGAKKNGHGLRVLRIVESGTTGMFGSFDDARSKMFMALVSLGYTEKGPGSGGSFGFGKAGLIGGSATRTVIAYSCFRPRSDDLEGGEAVTRRLLGMTYWGQHNIGHESFTGFARLGSHQDGWVKPLVNDAADQLASQLGFEVREPDSDAKLGTSFLIIDPVVDPSDLKNAIERNWWAAIEERRFTPVITHTDESGQTTSFIPRPKKNPAIAAFVRSYEVATVPQDNKVEHEAVFNLGELPKRLGRKNIGKLGLVADLNGWSYAIDAENKIDDQVDHTSLVALVRSPLMTVQYFQPRGTRRPPYVRGVFVADDDVDDLLRQTEPKAHDMWMTSKDKIGDGVDREAPEVAEIVLREVSAATRKFHNRIKPAPPDASDSRLVVLAELFREISRGDSTEAPHVRPADEPDFLISITASQEPAGSDSFQRMKGNVRISLAEAYDEADEVLARIRISYRFVEDERAGAECSLELSENVDSPDEEGWVQVVVGRYETTIGIVSDAYPIDWSGRLGVLAEVVRPIGAGELG